MDECVEAGNFGIALPWPRSAYQPVGYDVVGGSGTPVLDVSALLAEQVPLTKERKSASDAAPAARECQANAGNYIISDDVVPMAPPECRRQAPDEGAPAVAPEEALLERRPLPTGGRVNVADVGTWAVHCVPTTQECSERKIDVFEVVEKIRRKEANVVNHGASKEYCTPTGPHDRVGVCRQVGDGCGHVAVECYAVLAHHDACRRHICRCMIKEQCG